MKRITDFRKIEYIVPDGTPLPDEIRHTLELYIGKRVRNTKTGQWGTQYTIPIYLMQEWLRNHTRLKRGYLETQL